MGFLGFFKPKKPRFFKSDFYSPDRYRYHPVTVSRTRVDRNTRFAVEISVLSVIARYNYFRFNYFHFRLSIVVSVTWRSPF